MHTFTCIDTQSPIHNILQLCAIAIIFFKFPYVTQNLLNYIHSYIIYIPKNKNKKDGIFLMVLSIICVCFICYCTFVHTVIYKIFHPTLL